MTEKQITAQYLRKVTRWKCQRQAKLTPDQRRFEHRQDRHFRHLIRVNRAMERIALGDLLPYVGFAPWRPSQLMFVTWDREHPKGRHRDFASTVTKPRFVPLYPIDCDMHWMAIHRLACCAFDYDPDGYFLRLMNELPAIKF